MLTLPDTINVGICEVEDDDTIEDITAQCSVSFADITVPTVTDDCGNTFTGTTDQTIFPVTTQGTTTITWTYTTLGGTTFTQTQSIIIDDVTAPVPEVATLADITAECSITAEDITAPTATDNCTGTVTVTNDAVFPIEEQGTTVITWTYTDVKGNAATQTQNVIIDDATGPELILQDATVTLTEDGTVTITAAQFNNGSTDACGIATWAITPESFTCDDLGAQTVTITVTDVNGNETEGTAQVTITDPEDYCTINGTGSFNLADVTLYPNPTSSVVTISAPQSAGIKSVTVYSLTGQELYKAAANGVTAYSLQLSPFAEGTYLVNIETASGSATRRVVKSN